MRTSINKNVSKDVDNYVGTVDNFEIENNSNSTEVEDDLSKFDDENVDNLEDYVDNSEDIWGDSTDSGILVTSGESILLEKLSTGRIVRTVFVGLLFSGILSFIVLALYAGYIRFPKREVVIKENTGKYCLENWVVSLKNMTSLGENSNISQEIIYANGDEYKIKFYERMLNTVSYTPLEVNVKNVYGNDYIDKKTRDVVKEISNVEQDEEVELSYIDYTQVTFKEDVLLAIMSNQGIEYGCVDYENKIVDVFCEYMYSLTDDEIPIRKDNYIPNIVGDLNTGFVVNEDEDIYIDRLLFSSKEFKDLLNRFSEVVARVSGGVELVPTKEWTTWNSLTEEDKEMVEEPAKYNHKEVISSNWCGVYYLKNEYTVKDSNGNIIKTGVSANLGDGTFGNPAGLDTPVITSVFIKEQDAEGKEVINQYPIKVVLRDYKVSEDAIALFESKDIKNRGIDVTSEVQYCSCIIEVTNLSNKELTIMDNISLSDQNANLFTRSGELFGLNNILVLQPDESGIIESWSKSTELNKKYLIWGADFERRIEPVWFRVLMGNLEDDSEDKGVSLNKTRDKESEIEDNNLNENNEGEISSEVK